MRAINILMRGLLPAAWITAGCGMVLGDLITSEAVVSPDSKSTVTITVMGVGSDSETVSYSGSLRGEAEIDRETGKISRLKVLPSRVFSSDVTLRIPLSGGFYLQLKLVGISSLASSGDAFLPVQADGRIDKDDLTLIVDRGTATFSSNVPGSTPVVVDYSKSPQVTANSGTSTISTIRVAGSDFLRTWRIDHLDNVDRTDSQSAGGLTIETREVGTIRAAATKEIPTAYAGWLDENQLPNLPYVAPNPANGIPNGIIFALGLPLKAGVQIPLRPEIVNGIAKVWMFEAPSGGTAAPLAIEGTSDLRIGSWRTVVNIPRGHSGRIPIVSSEKARFFRIVGSRP